MISEPNAPVSPEQIAGWAIDVLQVLLPHAIGV